MEDSRRNKNAREKIFLNDPSTINLETPPNGTCCLRVVAILSTIIAIILGISLILTNISIHKDRDTKCKMSPPISRDFEKPDLLDDLTPTEMKNVRNYLYRQKSLNIQKHKLPTLNQTYIYTMTLFAHPKKTVLDYLDGKIRAPKRRALVVLYRGDLVPPRVEEYIVSPVDKPDSHSLYKNPVYRKFPIPFNSRAIDGVEFYLLEETILKTYETLYPVLIRSYGLSYHNCTGENCLTYSEVTPPDLSADKRTIWVMAFFKVDGFYLFPLGLDILFDSTSINSSDWQAVLIWYNGQSFHTAEELLQKYQSGSIQKIKLSRPDLKNLYSSYKQNIFSKATPQAGPRLIEPEGRRFTIKNQQVDYMKWSFKFGTDIALGLRLNDVRFGNDRLAFEIIQSETTVFYSGYGPIGYTSVYYDSSWLLGLNSKQLTRDIDCPDTAVFLDSYFFVDDEPVRIKNAICIFENNPGIPLRRHYVYPKNTETLYGGIVDYHLVVRSIATIWNYDYIFDFRFHQNGQLDVGVSPTGYVFSIFSDNSQEARYTNKIGPNTAALIHQHLFHYKVDLDIGGISNRFSTVDFKTESVSKPEFHSIDKTQLYFTETLKNNEKEAAIQYNFSEPKYYVIYKKGNKNSFGQERGYKIHNNGKTKFLFPNDKPYLAAPWAHYQIAVTKQKDTEVSSSSIYHQFGFIDPMVSFDDFIKDNESIVDEDLVAWVSMGVHHLPGTEDVPSTTTSGSFVSFSLKPYNYFDECPSRSSTDCMDIGVGQDNQPIFTTSNTYLNFTCTPKYVGFYGYIPQD